MLASMEDTCVYAFLHHHQGKPRTVGCGKTREQTVNNKYREMCGGGGGGGTLQRGKTRLNKLGGWGTLWTREQINQTGTIGHCCTVRGGEQSDFIVLEYPHQLGLFLFFIVL